MKVDDGAVHPTTAKPSIGTGRGPPTPPRSAQRGPSTAVEPLQEEKGGKEAVSPSR